MIHIYCGDGKGKSTAAAGLALRCAGYGNNVLFVRFFKNDCSGELKGLRMMPEIELLSPRKSFGFYWNLSEQEKAELKQVCRDCLEEVEWRISRKVGEKPEEKGADRQLCEEDHWIFTKETKNAEGNGAYKMLVLDEIMAVMKYEIITVEEMLEFLKRLPENMEVVMTGRNPDLRLVEAADYVSEIRKIKHPYDKGVTARKGIEF